MAALVAVRLSPTVVVNASMLLCKVLSAFARAVASSLSALVALATSDAKSPAISVSFAVALLCSVLIASDKEDSAPVARVVSAAIASALVFSAAFARVTSSESAPVRVAISSLCLVSSASMLDWSAESAFSLAVASSAMAALMFSTSDSCFDERLSILSERSFSAPVARSISAFNLLSNSSS